MRLKSICVKIGIIGMVAGLCMAASGGCGSDLHKATLAAGSIAASLKTAADINHGNTFETADEKALVANIIVQTAVANNNFIGDLTAAEKSGGTITASQVVDSFGKLVTQVDQLNTLGVLKLKSPQAQATYSVVIASIQAEVAILQGLLPTQTTANRHPCQGAAAGGLVASAGVVFTPAEIAELLSLAIAAGSTLVEKIEQWKGETDAEILAQAETDDESAIAEAEEDGAADPATPDPVPDPSGEEAAEEPVEDVKPKGETAVE